MALHAKLVGVDEFLRLVWRGMSHRPLEGFLVPLMTILPFLNTLRLYFPNRATQSLSENFPIEMRDPVFRLSRMWPVWACLERMEESGMVASCVACMVVPDADRTVGPVVFGVMVVHDLILDRLM